MTTQPQNTIHTASVSSALETLDALDPAERATTALWLRECLDGTVTLAVDEMRARGDSWAAIGAALGTTRQNAYQRYGRG